MVSGINPNSMHLLNWNTLTDRQDIASRNTFNQRSDEPVKIKISEETGLSRPFAPEMTTKATSSGSMVYEPNSLLADLSGANIAQNITSDLYKPSPIQKMYCLQEDIPQPEEELPSYTFEIIV